MQNSLEQELEQPEPKDPLVKRVLQGMKNYAVDTSAGWIFWPIFMAPAEYASGYDGYQILQSRLTAAAFHAVFLRLYGRYRERWSQHYNVTPESSLTTKLLSETTCQVTFQAPQYLLILCSLGRWDNLTRAFFAGLGIGAVGGRLYGYWLDVWRKVWGNKPVLDK